MLGFCGSEVRGQEDYFARMDEGKGEEGLRSCFRGRVEC